MLKHIERSRGHESLDTAVERIAYAYGFSLPPVSIPKKTIQQSKADPKTTASLAIMKGMTNPLQPVSVNPPQPISAWGIAPTGKRTTVVSFAITAAKHAIANALIVKTIQAIAELVGFTKLMLSVSSVGDMESRRRFARELGTFFKKYSTSLSPDIEGAAHKDPETGYEMLVENNDPLLERAPKTIDYLSENSRKIMLDALALFEAVNIPYSLAPHLKSDAHAQNELLFALTGVDRKGNEVHIATGGHYDEYAKREMKVDTALSMSIEINESLEAKDNTQAVPSCYVVHVGDIAKLKAFSTIENLWRANLLVGETFLAETLREQIDRARASQTKYIAIIGQREAIDGTVIVRNTSTQLQTVIPLERLASHVGRQ